jgi:TRAP-type transport system periplasmic protein
MTSLRSATGPYRKLRLKAVIGLCVAVLLAACGTDDGDPVGDDAGEAAGDETVEEVVWTWEHGLGLAGTASDYMFTEWLPEALSEASNGRLTVDVAYAETDPTETLESVQAGRFDGGSFVSSNYAGSHPLFVYSEIAFLLEHDEYEEVSRGAGGDIVSEALSEEPNIMHLGGEVSWTLTVPFSVEPMEQVADWAGQRLRVANVVQSNAVDALGGAGVTMPFGDLYPAIERGAVDGFLTSTNASLPLNPWDVTNYVNMWHIGWGGVYPILNENSYNDLPEDLQDVVRQVFEEFEDVAWERSRQDIQMAEDRYNEEGMEIVVPSDDVLQEAEDMILEDLLNDWLDLTGERGQQLLDEIRAVTGG